MSLPLPSIAEPHLVVAAATGLRGWPLAALMHLVLIAGVVAGKPGARP
jgi:hypothetical protein